MTWDFKPEMRNRAYKAAAAYFVERSYFTTGRTVADAVLDAIRDDVAAEIDALWDARNETDRYVRVHDQARRKEESAHNETLAALRRAKDEVTDLVLKVQFLIDNEVKALYTFPNGDIWYPRTREDDA